MRILLFLVALPAPAFAGIHGCDPPANAFPVEWPGFLRDLRAVRLAGTPSSPLTERYATGLRLSKSSSDPRLPDAGLLATCGAFHLRLNEPAKALDILRTAAKNFPSQFELASNLGTAWQMNGDLAQAKLALAEAVELAPKEWKEAERLQLKLVMSRLKEGKNSDDLDDLFGGKPPANAIALVQQLCIWLPNDARLLWQLAELAYADGDVRTAANLMDGAVAEYGLKSEKARKRRTQFRTEADELAKKEDHLPHKGTVKFTSTRVFAKLLDESKLPRIDPMGRNQLPWAAVVETTVGRKFEVKFLNYVDRLDGLKVSMIGFVRANGSGTEMTEFLLTEFPIGCWFCESPGPTQTIWVDLAPGTTFDHVAGAVEVVGTLKLNKLDPERPLMTITGAKVKQAQ
jgi:hypothetical protein